MLAFYSTRIHIVCLSVCAVTFGINVFAVQSSFPAPDIIRFETPENSAGYYILQESSELPSFYAIGIDLGIYAPVWDVVIDPAYLPNAFYRVRSASIFTPLDSDGDRIDDIYELLRPGILDPLDPSDANLDPDLNGLTHMQEYLRAISDTETAPQYYSREVTSFNFGVQEEAALSREWTTFNFGSPSAGIEAVSSELSLYNGEGPQPYPAIPLPLSRELTVYNLDLPSAVIEAISAEVSLYNGSGPPTYADLPQMIAREISVFNFGVASAPIEAISRELTVNALSPTLP